MPSTPSPDYVARAVGHAVHALTTSNPGVAPEHVGATAAAVAVALLSGQGGARPGGAAPPLPAGVRFVTGPAAGFPNPDDTPPVHVFPGVVPGGPHPSAPGPGDPFPAVVNPAVFGPSIVDTPTPIEPGPYPGGPQPIEPGPYPGGPQPIEPGGFEPFFPAVVNPAVQFGPSIIETPTPIEPGPYPGGPQPIEPGPYPGGPQPIEPGPGPGGLPWERDPNFGVLVFEQFLDQATARRLEELVRNERARFQPSTVIHAGMVTVEPTRRAAVTLAQTPRWVVDLFTGRLDGVLEFVCARFGLRPNHAGHQWDVHVTATPPGGGFVPHIDNGTPAIADRVLSWVYHVANGSFSGGELTLYDAREPRALLEGLTRRAMVQPTPNTLVVFPSWLVHEITPVASSADSLGRTTVHGWLRWPRA